MDDGRRLGTVYPMRSIPGAESAHQEEAQDNQQAETNGPANGDGSTKIDPPSAEEEEDKDDEHEVHGRVLSLGPFAAYGELTLYRLATLDEVATG
jgi:hypothetical protein